MRYSFTLTKEGDNNLAWFIVLASLMYVCFSLWFIPGGIAAFILYKCIYYIWEHVPNTTYRVALVFGILVFTYLILNALLPYFAKAFVWCIEGGCNSYLI